MSLADLLQFSINLISSLVEMTRFIWARLRGSDQLSPGTLLDLFDEEMDRWDRLLDVLTTLSIIDQDEYIEIYVNISDFYDKAFERDPRLR